MTSSETTVLDKVYAFQQQLQSVRTGEGREEDVWPLLRGQVRCILGSDEFELWLATTATSAPRRLGPAHAPPGGFAQTLVVPCGLAGLELHAAEGSLEDGRGEALQLILDLALYTHLGLRWTRLEADRLTNDVELVRSWVHEVSNDVSALADLGRMAFDPEMPPPADPEEFVDAVDAAAARAHSNVRLLGSLGRAITERGGSASTELQTVAQLVGGHFAESDEGPASVAVEFEATRMLFASAYMSLSRCDGNHALRWFVAPHVDGWSVELLMGLAPPGATREPGWRNLKAVDLSVAAFVANLFGGRTWRVCAAGALVGLGFTLPAA